MSDRERCAFPDHWECPQIRLACVPLHVQKRAPVRRPVHRRTAICLEQQISVTAVIDCLLVEVTKVAVARRNEHHTASVGRPQREDALPEREAGLNPGLDVQQPHVWLTLSSPPHQRHALAVGRKGGRCRVEEGVARRYGTEQATCPIPPYQLAPGWRDGSIRKH